MPGAMAGALSANRVSAMLSELETASGGAKSRRLRGREGAVANGSLTGKAVVFGELS